MSITAHFMQLGAPLANSRWSWGGVDDERRRVFLRAWQDETRMLDDGKRIVRLGYHALFSEKPSDLGWKERLRHIDLLRNGYSGFAVLCKARDPSSQPRAIQSYDNRDVFRLGQIVDVQGDDWGELLERLSIKALR